MEQATAYLSRLWVDYNDFLVTFKGTDIRKSMQEHTEVPIFIVVAYLGLVFYVPQLMADRQPMNLKIFFTLWNLLLAVFSMIGTYYTVPVLVNTFFKDGFRYTLCENPDDWYADGPSGYWVALFILSKIPELMDTFFLVAQKKPVRFLHWFHHCTVMLYCWHAYVSVIGGGIWFATMNYCVHSLMYTYYFMMNLPECFSAFAKKFAKLITTLQLMQMVVGSYVTGASAYYKFIAPDNCVSDPANLKLGLGMYLSYFYLFATLYKELYGPGAKPRRSKGHHHHHDAAAAVDGKKPHAQ